MAIPRPPRPARPRHGGHAATLLLACAFSTAAAPNRRASVSPLAALQPSVPAVTHEADIPPHAEGAPAPLDATLARAQSVRSASEAVPPAASATSAAPQPSSRTLRDGTSLDGGPLISGARDIVLTHERAPSYFASLGTRTKGRA